MDFFDYDDSSFWLEPDFVFTDLIMTMVNTLNMPIGVTLMLKGMVVTGVLVSEQSYLQTLSNTFNEMMKADIKAAGEDPPSEDIFDFTMLSESAPLDSMIQRMAQEMQEKEKNSSSKKPQAEDWMDWDDDDDDEDEDVMPGPIRYLHLSDPVVISPLPGISFANSLLPVMRLRLTMVDGWILGQAIDPDELQDGDEAASDEPTLH